MVFFFKISSSALLTEGRMIADLPSSSTRIPTTKLILFFLGSFWNASLMPKIASVGISVRFEKREFFVC